MGFLGLLVTFVTKDSYLCVLGHGPAATALLHQLESQHLPHRATVRGSVVGGDVQTGEILVPGPELQIRSWSYRNKFGGILRSSKFSKRINPMKNYDSVDLRRQSLKRLGYWSLSPPSYAVRGKKSLIL